MMLSLVLLIKFVLLLIIFQISFSFDQGHPTSKLAKNPLRDISRLLVMFKDYLKSCFDQLEKFDLFGFLS